MLAVLQAAPMRPALRGLSRAATTTTTTTTTTAAAGGRAGGGAVSHNAVRKAIRVASTPRRVETALRLVARFQRQPQLAVVSASALEDLLSRAHRARADIDVVRGVFGALKYSIAARRKKRRGSGGSHTVVGSGSSEDADEGRPSARAYGIAMQANLRSGKAREAVRLYEELSESAAGKALPNAVCRAAIGAFSKVGKPRRALGVALSAMEAGHKGAVDTAAADVLLTGFSSGENDCEAAQRIWNMMDDWGVKKDLRLYHAWLAHCQRHGLWEEACSTVRELENAPPDTALAPVARTYAMAMVACNKANQFRRVRHLLSDLRRRGLRPDLLAYRSAMIAMHSLEEYDSLIKLYSAATREGKWDDKILMFALGACLRLQRSQTAAAFVEEPHVQGLLRPEMVAAVLATCAAANDQRSARAVVESLQGHKNHEALIGEELWSLLKRPARDFLTRHLLGPLEAAATSTSTSTATDDPTADFEPDIDPESDVAVVGNESTTVHTLTER